MPQYIWKNGGFKVKAQIAGDHLEQLQQEHGGRLTPRVVLDAARPVDAPLHPCFEWDDTRAADLYREDQARSVIRSIRVVRAATDGESRVVRAYVNIIEQVGQDAQHAYVPIQAAMDDEAMRQQILVRARRDLLAWRDRYAEMEALVGVADEALDRIEQIGAPTAA